MVLNVGITSNVYRKESAVQCYSHFTTGRISNGFKMHRKHGYHSKLG